ncbi:MAG: AfsR/SARP family transcriptional regulator [Actinobacteria bacterium]|nr:AfsR/SARP family transcriptional regulator [Actinomycetota bacterium]
MRQHSKPGRHLNHASSGGGGHRLQELRFRVLGLVEVRRGGKPVSLAGQPSVNLLAGLLLSANQPVSYASLATIVWGDSLPAHPQAALQSLKSRLCRVLGEDAIQARGCGYQMPAQDDTLDLLRFWRLSRVADAALSENSPHRALAALDQALGLWQLPILANVRSDVLLRDGVSFLMELYLGAQEKRAGLQLRLGLYPAVIAELSGLVSAHPFREVLVGLLMLALYRSHRQADALAVYERLRQALRESLGVDPDEALQRLHLSLLRRDACLDQPDPAGELVRADVIPAEIPPLPRWQCMSAIS